MYGGKGGKAGQDKTMEKAEARPRSAVTRAGVTDGSAQGKGVSRAIVPGIHAGGVCGED